MRVAINTPLIDDQVIMIKRSRKLATSALSCQVRTRMTAMSQMERDPELLTGSCYSYRAWRRTWISTLGSGRVFTSLPCPMVSLETLLSYSCEPSCFRLRRQVQVGRRSMDGDGSQGYFTASGGTVPLSPVGAWRHKKEKVDTCRGLDMVSLHVRAYVAAGAG